MDLPQEVGKIEPDHSDGNDIIIEPQLCEEQKDQDTESRRHRLMRCLRSFANDASIVGLYKLLDNPTRRRSKTSKAAWMSFLLIGVAIMVYQIQECIAYYLSYPTKVEYRLQYNQSLPFPTVTVCSGTTIPRKKIEVNYGADITKALSDISPPFPDLDHQPKYETFEKLALNYNKQLPPFEEFLQTMNAILLECKFENRLCDSSKALRPINTDYGRCFSFNPETTNYQTTQPGSTNGLRLVLYYNQSDVLTSASPGAGFKVVLHDRNELPFVSVMGFSVSPGRVTSIPFTLRTVSELPSPYGNCKEEQNYTYARCGDQCYGGFIFENCHCFPFQFKRKSSDPVCDVIQMAKCMPRMSKLFVLSGSGPKCKCPLHCNQRTYPFSITSSPLSQLYLNHSAKSLNFRAINVKKEIAFVDIFFSQMTYTKVQTTPAYDALYLFCDIGNALGLILGACVITTFELIQLLVELIAASSSQTSTGGE